MNPEPSTRTRCVLSELTPSLSPARMGRSVLQSFPSLADFPPFKNGWLRRQFRFLLTMLGGMIGLAACRSLPDPQSLPHRPAESALIPASTHIPLSDGSTAPARLYQPRPATPLRGIILAFHGFGDSRDGWELMAPPLTQAGYLIVAPDIRGFGAFPTKDGWSTTERMVADSVEEAHWCRQHWPTLPLNIMGESMGGTLALLTSTTLTQRTAAHLPITDHAPSPASKMAVHPAPASLPHKSKDGIATPRNGNRLPYPVTEPIPADPEAVPPQGVVSDKRDTPKGILLPAAQAQAQAQAASTSDSSPPHPPTTPTTDAAAPKGIVSDKRDTPEGVLHPWPGSPNTSPSPTQPEPAHLILLAPAIMTIGEPWQTLLDGWNLLTPRAILTGANLPGHHVATRNIKALRRFFFDPLTRHSTNVHALHGLTHLMARAAREAKNLHTPSLLIWGDRDQFVPASATRRFIKHAPANTLRLDELPHGYHLISREPDDRPAKDIASWLEDPARFLPSGGDSAATQWLWLKDTQ